MILVLDASVAVAAARIREPAHRVSRTRVRRVLTGMDEIVVPSIFSVEVGASLARAGEPLGTVRAYVEALLARATVVPLGVRAARAAREMAMRYGLRAADGVYVWVASREGLPLCTLDEEIALRTGAVCAVMRP
jgi:predicted nucleic acid-binding protein